MSHLTFCCISRNVVKWGPRGVTFGRAQPWPPCDGSARYTAAAPGPQGSNYGGWKINITKQEISDNKKYNEFTVRKCCIEGLETSRNTLY